MGNWPRWAAMIDVLICFKLQPFSFHKSMRIVDAIDHRESYQLWPHQCWQRRMCRMLQPMSLLQRPIKTLHLKLCNLHDEKSRKTCRSSLHQFVNLFWLVNLPPPQRTPPRNRALLLRAYLPLVSLDKAFLKPYFWAISHPIFLKSIQPLRAKRRHRTIWDLKAKWHQPAVVEWPFGLALIQITGKHSCKSTTYQKNTSIITLFCKHWDESDEEMLPSKVGNQSGKKTGRIPVIWEHHHEQQGKHHWRDRKIQATKMPPTPRTADLLGTLKIATGTTVVPEWSSRIPMPMKSL